MSTMLGQRRPTDHRVVLVLLAALGVGLIASWLLVSWAAPAPMHAADQPATSANDGLDGDGWGTAGCFVPGAALDAVPGLFDFRHACSHHGGCYQGLDRTGAPAVVDRLSCDQTFRSDLHASCEVLHAGPTTWRSRECANTAESYYAVVRSFGAPYYKGSGNPA